MNYKEVISELSGLDSTENKLQSVKVDGLQSVKVYPKSLHEFDDVQLFIGVEGIEKNLFIVSAAAGNANAGLFAGEVAVSTADYEIKKCALSHENALKIQDKYDFARSKAIGVTNSYGVGDRLGIANAGHIRAAEGFDMKLILAQQSIRELERTGRTPEDVMDAAVWAIIQEGYHEGFGSDADHLKNTDDIDLMIKAGFVMFTIDPSDYVNNDADSLAMGDLEAEIKKLPWKELNTSFEAMLAEYENVDFILSDNFTLKADKETIMRGMVKYGKVINHTVNMVNYLKDKYADKEWEIELSVDETESITTPFEHYFVVSELKKRQVELVSLAPRFVGEFNKGIDFRGDLDLFKSEYIKHLEISEKLGPYKISIHSGSDKFSVYWAIGELKKGFVHVKTAGTSYLEALHAIAIKEPALFKEIMDFSRAHYEVEKKTYHVVGELSKVKAASDCTDAELLDYFNQDDARQVLHVNFGKVLTEKDSDGNFLFYNRFMTCLKENEETHYEVLIKHFKKHFEPFMQG
jgi:hypothetical protein